LKPLGLIAGNGQFPLLFAREAKRLGRRVVAVAIKEETDPALEKEVDRFHWMDLGQIEKTIEALRAEGVEEAVMAGQVKHTQLFRRLKLDFTAVKILATLPNKKTDTVLGAIADEFARAKIRFLPSTVYLQHLLSPKGYMTSARPTKEQKKDIEFGFETAKAVGAIDVGQTVCVKDLTVVAVEAMEGTDECIRRAGIISGGGFTAVKTAKPRQDVRFDVPVIGSGTMESLKESGAAVMAVEAGRTLFFDKERFLAEAEKAGLILFGREAP
jgi:DUF1009 family protein